MQIDNGWILFSDRIPSFIMWVCVEDYLNYGFKFYF